MGKKRSCAVYVWCRHPEIQDICVCVGVINVLINKIIYYRYVCEIVVSSLCRVLSKIPYKQ